MTLEVAVMERARAYVSTDAPLLHQVRAEKGLSAAMVARISKIYGVRRNLGDETSLKIVTESLNTAVEEWPDDLKCRADRCLKVSEALSLPKKPLSAVTKLVWFLRPEGWTVYDSYAWRGLSCGGNKGEERLREFYCKLHKKKFSHAAARIDGILSDTVWANIAGTRVLDVLMMLNGGLSVTLSDPNARQGFVDALPSGSGRALQDVARRIQEEMADDPFIKFVEQR